MAIKQKTRENPKKESEDVPQVPIQHSALSNVGVKKSLKAYANYKLIRNEEKSSKKPKKESEDVPQVPIQHSALSNVAIRLKVYREDIGLEREKEMDSFSDSDFLSKGPECMFKLLEIAKNYYGNDFEMPRVQKFVNWVKENYQYLYDKIFKEMNDPTSVFYHCKGAVQQMVLLGVVLGREYLLYSLGDQKREISPKYKQDATSTYMYDPKNNAVIIPLISIGELNITESLLFQVFLYAFNSGGIHEHTHALGGRKPLGELSAAYMQNKLALPIRAALLPQSWVGRGVRDYWQVAKEMKEKRLEADKYHMLLSFYFSGWCAPWVASYYGGGIPIYEFQGKGKEPEVTLVDLYSRRLDAEKFFRQSGIKDRKLKVKFRNVFDQLKKSKWKDIDEFMEILENAMNKEFGPNPIKQLDLKDGWVILGKWGNHELNA
jgi:hypothetical protein